MKRRTSFCIDYRMYCIGEGNRRVRGGYGEVGILDNTIHTVHTMHILPLSVFEDVVRIGRLETISTDMATKQVFVSVYAASFTIFAHSVV
jgi:hypothetical protein